MNTPTNPELDTPDSHLDVHTCVEMLIEVLTHARKSKAETPETGRANTYLFERLLNYKVMMRQRPLLETYEFLIPPNNQGVGWYYRPTVKAKATTAFNWIGPFTSRKAAVTARMATRGTPKIPLDIIEREILGQILEPRETQ